MKWHRMGACIIALACTSLCLPTRAQKYDLDTYPSESKTLWHQALSGNNCEVLAIINNRPFAFDTSETFKSEQKRAEPILREALAVARRYQNQLPRDLVDCLCNLGSFRFISGEIQDADKWFTEAIAVADRHTVHDSLAMSALLDHAALVARAARDYPRAYSLYLRSLEIRRKFVDEHHPDVSHSLMNLASVCRDMSTDAGDKWSRQAAALERQADSLMNNSEYISSSHSNGLPRPVVPNLILNKGRATLPSMVEFAKSIIDKHRKIIEPPQAEPGLATIVGRWTVPSDIVSEEIVKVQHSSEEKVEGKFDTTKTRMETASPVENIAIYLVRQSDQTRIWGAINSYGSTKGCAIADFCGNGENRWPATLKQADAVKQAADLVIQSLAVKSAQTDKNGDYEIAGIPKGTYFLYASLATSRHVLMWMLPNDREITVARVCQVKYNFAEEQARTLFDVNFEASAQFVSPAPTTGRSNRLPRGSYFVSPPNP